MRVLFSVSEWPTHYMAMVPTAWALQAAGHDVRVLCAPSQREHVAAAGLVPVPVLGGMTVVTRNRLDYLAQARAGLWPYPWLPPHPVTGEPLTDLDGFDEAAFERDHAPALRAESAASCDRAVDFARQWRPDLVLHDPVALEGLLAARVLGVPGVLMLWGPVGPAEPEHARIVPYDTGGSFARYGLASDPLDSVGVVADPCPASIAPPVPGTRLPVRYVPYNGPGPALPWMLDEPRLPRVCVVWSTALTAMAGPGSNVLPAIVRGAAELPVEVVVTATARDLELLGPLPPTVRAVERVPLHLLLPTCAAVVHHGGGGSTMTALNAGVPQLIVSCATEQAVSGERVASGGAGCHLTADRATPGTVTAALRTLLGDDCTSRARELRAELHDRPSPAVTVRALEQLAAG